MSVTDLSIASMNAIVVGNILRNEGIDAGASRVECAPDVKKRLSVLCLEVYEKSSPYLLKDEEGYSPFIEAGKELSQFPDRLAQKAADLGNRLYESGENLQIPTTTFMTIVCDVEVGGELVGGLILLGFSGTEGLVSYKANSEGHHFSYVDVLTDRMIDRFVLWHEGAKELYALDGKSVANKYWLNDFLGVKPVLTEKKATGAATQLIKKVSSKIQEEEDLSSYKQAMKDLLAESDEISFDDIKECSLPFVDEEVYDKVKESLETQSQLSLQGNYPLQTIGLDKKMSSFVKTLKLTPKLDVTLKGAQEVVSMEKIESSEDDTILIRLKLKPGEGAAPEPQAFTTPQRPEYNPPAPVTTETPAEMDDDVVVERGFDDDYSEYNLND